MNQQEDTAVVAGLDRRFGGLARLYGKKGADRIRRAHIVIVGLGGVGSWAAEAAARSGVARLTLIDLDHISESNINRQVHALEGTVGMAKVEAMRQRIAQIHPGCDVSGIEEFVEPENWPQLLDFESSFDWRNVAVIDACDQVKAKITMAAWSRTQPALFISAGAAGGKRLAHQVDIDDLCRVTHDPLLAQVRNRLRREHGAPRDGKKIGVPCVFSTEPVMQPVVEAAPAGVQAVEIDANQDATLNCHGYGSVVTVTSTFGLCAAGWVLGKIADAA
jgi:tRNA threonylcarbamoyladenosine dehydratase